MQLCILMSCAEGVVGNCITLDNCRRWADQYWWTEIFIWCI